MTTLHRKRAEFACNQVLAIGFGFKNQQRKDISVGGGNRAPQFRRGFFKIQDAGHKLAERAAQMSQHALLQ